MKAKIIIQARTNSNRLPGKVLLNILGKPVLEHVIERAGKAKNAGGVIVATTTNDEDLPIAAIAERLGVDVYRGSEDDVLDRFYQAAKHFSLQHIVRITADCPLIDPAVIDEGIDGYFSSGANYCSNVLERTFPDGEDVEVFSFNALETAWKEAKLSSEREHVTTYIRKHAEKFKLSNFSYKTNAAVKRWTLDEEKDFVFIKSVYEKLYLQNSCFGMEDILRLLEADKHLEAINKAITSGAGYIKSLKEDKIIK